VSTGRGSTVAERKLRRRQLIEERSINIIGLGVRRDSVVAPGGQAGREDDDRNRSHRRACRIMTPDGHAHKRRPKGGSAAEAMACEAVRLASGEREVFLSDTRSRQTKFAERYRRGPPAEGGMELASADPAFHMSSLGWRRAGRVRFQHILCRGRRIGSFDSR
jgi:hypothetical protein